MLPVDEKAQHEPHWPWFFTGVTTFLVRQSMDDGRLTLFEGTCTPRSGRVEDGRYVV